MGKNTDGRNKKGNVAVWGCYWNINKWKVKPDPKDWLNSWPSWDGKQGLLGQHRK
jgi:hypothetical protein